MKKKNVLKREIKSKKTHERNTVKLKISKPTIQKVSTPEFIEEVKKMADTAKKTLKKHKPNNPQKPVEPVVEVKDIENNEQNV